MPINSLHAARSSTPAARTLALLLLAAGLCAPLSAQPPQDPPPPPADPAPAAPAVPVGQPVGDLIQSGAPDLARTDPMGRRPMTNNDAVLAFPEATVKQIIPFIVESTGKVVIPNQTVLPIRISIVNDKPIPRQKALDLVFFALQQAGVAVIENADFIILTEAANNPGNVPLPVLGPTVNTQERTDLGSLVQKIFRLRHASASNVAEIVKSRLPDKTPIIADNDSAQVIITAPVSLLQSVEQIIAALDQPPADLPSNETFHLQYADADVIAQNIRDLFADTPSTSRRTTPNQQPNQGGNRQPGGNQGGRQPGRGGGNPAAILMGIAGGDTGSGTRLAATPSSAILRVTSNQTLKTVTVLAESNILKMVRDLIEREWDKPLPDMAKTQRVYDLKFIDPVRLKAILEGTYGTGTATGGGNRSTTNPLSGQFTFQAIPEAHRLLVTAKIPGLIDGNIDQIIDGLDRPLTTGLPDIIELKHVQAEDLAEQLNALLAQEGTYAQVARVNTELSAGSTGSTPLSETTSNENGFSQTSSNIQYLQLWWQRARPPTDNAGASNLIAKVRIVPIAKRNSLLVLATPEYQEAVKRLIEQLDRPGRQVLIAAVIAEISAEDALELGLRFSNQAITTTKPDAAIGIGPSQGNTNLITGQQTNLLPSLFSTSVLNVGLNVNAVLQALNEKSKVTILSEPRIFTGDNIEADFFDGQDIPFITDSQPNQLGNLVQSFDYRAVGINLRVRPRITPERNVDIKVNLELSSIEPNQTLFGGFIVDRRQTTTQLIVGDGQTVVISGIMRSTDSDIRRKIPFLGDLPVLGELFKSTDRVKTNTELVAFITPIVVNGQEDSDKVNNADRVRLGELRSELGAAPSTPRTPPATLTPAPGSN